MFKPFIYLSNKVHSSSRKDEKVVWRSFHQHGEAAPNSLALRAYEEGWKIFKVSGSNNVKIPDEVSLEQAAKVIFKETPFTSLMPYQQFVLRDGLDVNGDAKVTRQEAQVFLYRMDQAGDGNGEITDTEWQSGINCLMKGYMSHIGQTVGLSRKILERLKHKLANNQFLVSENHYANTVDVLMKDTSPASMSAKLKRAAERLDNFGEIGEYKQSELRRILLTFLAKEGNMPAVTIAKHIGALTSVFLDRFTVLDHRTLSVEGREGSHNRTAQEELDWTVKRVGQLLSPKGYKGISVLNSFGRFASKVRQISFSKPYVLQWRNPYSYRLPVNAGLAPMMASIETNLIQALKEKKTQELLESYVQDFLKLSELPLRSDFSERMTVLLQPLNQVFQFAMGLQEQVPIVLLPKTSQADYSSVSAQPMGLHCSERGVIEIATEDFVTFFEVEGKRRVLQNDRFASSEKDKLLSRLKEQGLKKSETALKQKALQLLLTLIHELVHARQAELEKTTERLEHPQDKLRRDDYRDNRKVYHDATTALILKGNVDSYYEQPLERDAWLIQDKVESFCNENLSMFANPAMHIEQVASILLRLLSRSEG